jgi:hypothetical protein
LDIKVRLPRNKMIVIWIFDFHSFLIFTHFSLTWFSRQNTQIVTNLQQTTGMLFQQLVNRMCLHCLFPACWQVINGLLTTCYKVVELNRLVISCSNNLLSSCNSTTCQQRPGSNLSK